MRGARLWPLGFVFAVLATACGGEGEPAAQQPTLGGEDVTEPPAEETPTPGTQPPAERLTIVGEDISFNKDELAVAANTPFFVEFDNRDEGIRHNFAVYASPQAEEPVAPATDIEEGPATQELSAPGLPAGEYFYRCDVHPEEMTGTLKVS